MCTTTGPESTITSDLLSTKLFYYPDVCPFTSLNLGHTIPLLNLMPAIHLSTLCKGSFITL